MADGLGKICSNEDTIADCEPINQVLDNISIQFVLPDGNDPDYIYCTMEEPVNLLSKRKMKEERRHAIVKIDVQEFTHEIIGYFFGELCAILRISDDNILYGFIYDLEHQNTKVFALDMSSENGDLQLKCKIKGRINDQGLNKVAAYDNYLFV